MTEILLFYGLLSIPVAIGFLYSLHLYHKHSKHKHGQSKGGPAG